jgi:hypothetical protein
MACKAEPFVQKLRLKRMRKLPHGRAGGVSWSMVFSAVCNNFPWMEQVGRQVQFQIKLCLQPTPTNLDWICAFVDRSSERRQVHNKEIMYNSEAARPGSNRPSSCVPSDIWSTQSQRTIYRLKK